MAKNNLKIDPSVKVVRPPRPLYMTILIWVVAPLLGLMFLETLVLFAGGMVPTIVAYMVDPSPKKQITKTVGYANSTGCFIVALDMWTYNNTVDQALHLMADPFNWLIMFGTASFGWLLYFIMRPLVETYLTITFDVRRKQFKSVEETLIKEWGDEVKKRAPDIPAEMLKQDEIAIKAGIDEIGTSKAKENPVPPKDDTGS